MRVTEDQAQKYVEFWLVLDEAVGCFKSSSRIKGANCGDSKVTYRKNKKGQPVADFEFLAKGQNHIKIEINIAEMAASPKEYIENMLQCLDDGMRQAKEAFGRIIVPTAAESMRLLQ